MKSIIYERNLPRYAATRILGKVAKTSISLSPLRFADIEPPQPPSQDWIKFSPLLSGICGSDLATIRSESSLYLENFVSFPFVMGHEVVGTYQTEDGTTKRAVLIPTLTCDIRGISPRCHFCDAGTPQRCQMLTIGTIGAGLQTGFCAKTSGGWSQQLIAHKKQILDIPDTLTDEQAVLLEPFACAIHAALSVGTDLDTQVAVIGSGTLGLLTIQALRSLHPDAEIIATAKYDHQKELAIKMGASLVVSTSSLYRHARMMKNAFITSKNGSGDGFKIVFDAVGSSQSIAQSLNVTSPGGQIVLVGMPKNEKLDLTPLWMKEISLRGAYAYGMENLNGNSVSTFEIALTLATGTDLSQLLSATYQLEDFQGAIDHAMHCGPRGSVKIAFDMRKTRNRESWKQSK